MKPLAQLDQLNLDADTKQQITGIVQALLDQAQQAIRAQELKIQALTMELAHLRRIRFGKQNESLSSQPSLFEESVQAARGCLITCRALNIVMNQNPANAVSVAINWSKSVKM